MTGPDTQCLTCGDLADLAKAIDNLIGSYGKVLETANEPEDIDRRNEARERIKELDISRNRIASEVWRRATSTRHGNFGAMDANTAQWFEEGGRTPDVVRTLRGACILVDNSDGSCGEGLLRSAIAGVYLNREEARAVRDKLNEPGMGL